MVIGVWLDIGHRDSDMIPSYVRYDSSSCAKKLRLTCSQPHVTKNKNIIVKKNKNTEADKQQVRLESSFTEDSRD